MRKTAGTVLILVISIVNVSRMNRSTKQILSFRQACQPCYFIQKLADRDAYHVILYKNEQIGVLIFISLKFLTLYFTILLSVFIGEEFLREMEN